MVDLALSPSRSCSRNREFGPLLPGIERARRSYFQQLDLLPPSIKELAVMHCKKRIAATTDHVLLGELVPWMIAESVGCTNAVWMEHVCANWLQMYFGIILLDDVIDAQLSIDHQKAIMISSLLQQRGITGLLTAAKKIEGLRSSIDSSYMQSANAACYEIRQEASRKDSLSSNDILLVGEKVSMVRVCVAAIGDLAELTLTQLATIYGVLDDFLVAVQLLDDLTDWEEDMKLGRFTMPLSQLDRMHFPPVSSDKARNAIALLELVKTGALENTLATVVELLDRCSNSFDQSSFPKEICWRRHCIRLSAIGRDVIRELKRARTKLHIVFPNYNASNSLTSTECDILNRIAKSVRKELKTVAQSC